MHLERAAELDAKTAVILADRVDHLAVFAVAQTAAGPVHRARIAGGAQVRQHTAPHPLKGDPVIAVAAGFDIGDQRFERDRRGGAWGRR
jgi:hypothetical protein